MRTTRVALALLLLAFGACGDGGDSGTTIPWPPSSATTTSTTSTSTSLPSTTATTGVATTLPPTTVPPTAPTTTTMPLPPGTPRGIAYVRTHPITISALVASMGAPTTDIATTYFDDFGASVLTLWMDGHLEVEPWLDARPETPWVLWLRDDGRVVTLDGAQRIPGPIMGDLEPALPGRVAYQVGDEPNLAERMDDIRDGVDAIRERDPDALIYTNFSYWVPELEAKLAFYLSEVDADLISVSDFIYGPAHYRVLKRFRAAALEADLPYWTYINAYVGMESRYERSHHPSDLRWQAFSGLTFGYTGFTWFIYQARAGSHQTATDWGGSILFEDYGSWEHEATALFTTAAEINREIAHLGRVITQLRSTDVGLLIADHPSSLLPPEMDAWDAERGDPFVADVAPVDGQPPLEILVGTFRDDDGRWYTMVQNARHRHSTPVGVAPLPAWDEPGQIRITFDLDAAPDGARTDSVLAWDHHAGIERRVGFQGESEIVVLLEPGEVFLFTADDGRGFPLGPAVYPNE